VIYKNLILSSLIFIISCSPKAFIIDQPELVSIYFEKKIKKLEKNDMTSLDQQRDLMRTKVEYGFGIIMEHADRLIDVDYSSALDKYKKANIIFKDARDSGISILNDRYSNFNDWIRGVVELQFTNNDIIDLYWLAAAYGGAISSSRGDPFELIHLPKVGRILRKCIELDPEWNNGAVYSAMMSFTSTRTDISEDLLRDSVDFYFNKAILYSDSLDAGPFLAYAESIHKTYQERKEFEDKLNYVIDMKTKSRSRYELPNLIAKNRAEWLLSKTDDYFLE
tara:strand:+ start:10622 stop:11458 length:837 start_codon:yes stop_codon:yes gene_type:complete